MVQIDYFKNQIRVHSSTMGGYESFLHYCVHTQKTEEFQLKLNTCKYHFLQLYFNLGRVSEKLESKIRPEPPTQHT